MQFLEPDEAPEDERDEDELREDTTELQHLPVDAGPSPKRLRGRIPRRRVC